MSEKESLHASKEEHSIEEAEQRQELARKQAFQERAARREMGHRFREIEKFNSGVSRVRQRLLDLGTEMDDYFTENFQRVDPNSPRRIAYKKLLDRVLGLVADYKTGGAHSPLAHHKEDEQEIEAIEKELQKFMQ